MATRKKPDSEKPWPRAGDGAVYSVIAEDGSTLPRRDPELPEEACFPLGGGILNLGELILRDCVLDGNTVGGVIVDAPVRTSLGEAGILGPGLPIEELLFEIAAGGAVFNSSFSAMRATNTVFSNNQALGPVCLPSPFSCPEIEFPSAFGGAIFNAFISLSALASIGMRPLIIRKEIEAHIADRLMESVWREALWLVNDDIATTEEIDDAIRYGFGLRWAQMGLFETFRLAGGEMGLQPEAR